jgi:hypothetical protein
MQTNKRLATAFARLGLSVIGGFAAGHLLLNQGGTRPYAGPAGGVLATALTSVVVARKKKLNSLRSISIAPTAAKTTEPCIKKPSSWTTKQPSASPYLQFAFRRPGTPNYSRVDIWCHGFTPQKHWQNILGQNLAAIETIKWRAPKCNGPSIIQFTGEFDGRMSTEQFRNTVNLPLLEEAVKYNGDREIDTWMSFSN